MNKHETGFARKNNNFRSNASHDLTFKTETNVSLCKIKRGIQAVCYVLCYPLSIIKVRWTDYMVVATGLDTPLEVHNSELKAKNNIHLNLGQNGGLQLKKSFSIIIFLLF